MSLGPGSSLTPLQYDYYVDSVNGDDGNDGLTAGTAWATLVHALSESGPGNQIGLLSGGTYVPPITAFERGLAGVAQRATIDARIDLSGLAWTLHSIAGNGAATYKTIATVAEAPTQLNGATANSFHLMLWGPSGELMTWVVGGASVSANITAMATTPGDSFTARRFGGSNQDPRLETVSSETRYEIWAHLSDNTDPTGQAIKMTGSNLVVNASGGPYKNLRFIGNYGKDGNKFSAPADAPAGTIATIEDVDILDVPAHGQVGPVNGAGVITITGRSIAGSGLSFSSGGAINVFTNIDALDQDLTFQTVDATDCGFAFYGHPSSASGGYRSVTIASLNALRCQYGIAFDPRSDSTPFVSTCTVGAVDFEKIERAFTADGDLTVGGGTIVFAGNDVVGMHSALRILTNFRRGGKTFTLRNLTWDFNVPSGGFGVYILALCGSYAEQPTLVLDNCVDASPAARKAHMYDPNAGQPHIEITGGSILGDLLTSPSQTALPASLTVTAGCTFGFGNRTGPDIESYLTAQGIPHSISHDTTIVNRSGTVLSSPGW